MAGFADDERGVSEAAGVAILVGITILVTTLVGLNVLVATELDSDGVQANFSYDHVESDAALIITHVKGDEFAAGDLIIESDDAETTWAAAAEINESESVGPGDIVQLRRSNSFGKPVRQGTTIHIVHKGRQERTQLSEWSGE